MAPFFLGTNPGPGSGTELLDLTGQYSSLLMRRSFDLSGRGDYDFYRVKVRSDDGFIVWFNGHEWGRLNVSNSELSVNLTATDDEDGDFIDWKFELDNFAEFLVEGLNTVAVQGAAFGKSDDDFYSDMALVGVKPPEQAFSFSDLSPLSPFSFIGPGGFVLLNADEDSDVDDVLFRLPQGGSTILLTDPVGRVVDQATYSVSSEGLSEGRFPDGGEQIQFFVDGTTPESTNLTDQDQDGIPDQEERLLGLDPTNPNDAALEADEDGASNLLEHQTGTNSQDPTSFFGVKLIEKTTDGRIKVIVPVYSKRAYSLLMKQELDEPEWTKVTDILSGESLDAEIQVVEVPTEGSQALFQLVSPPRFNRPEEVLERQSPLPGQTDFPSKQSLEVILKTSVDPDSISLSDGWILRDEFDRTVKTEVQYENQFSRIVLRPRLALRSQASYRIDVDPAIRTRTGESIADLLGDWSFTTSPPLDLIEDSRVYNEDTSGVLRLDVTVVEDESPFTLDDLLNDRLRDDDFDPWIRVHTEGETFRPDLSGSNGIMKVRGFTTRLAVQKSFRIQLDKDEVDWRGHRRINLSKHPFELTRVRNRLSFELFEQIPHITSLRTQFVNLFVNGEDLGLYSQIERYDERFLENHGLDPNGHLYKANFFEWFRYEDKVKIKSDPDYNREEFESILEIEGQDNHEKLIRLLEDVNDFDLDFDVVFRQYFHRENYLTWMAINLLMGNLDTNSQNFMLYSPKDTQTWYILPWDYDGAWGLRRQPDNLSNRYPRWQQGLATYWNVTLHKRFMMNPANLIDLEAKMVELMEQWLTEEKIRSVLAQYRDVIREFIIQPPDTHRLPLSTEVSGDPMASLAEWESEYDRITTEIVFNHNLYQTANLRPMPVHLDRPQIEDEEIEFEWNLSHDLQGDPITYDLQVSTSPSFSESSIILEIPGLTTNEYTHSNSLPSGDYFFRVLMRDTADPEVNWQAPFRSYFDQETGTSFFGLRPFTIP